MAKKKKQIKKGNPIIEFDELLKKYPKHRFIGNCIFNLETLKKNMWIYNSKHPKIALLQEDHYIIVKNIFNGKFGNKGKLSGIKLNGKNN